MSSNPLTRFEKAVRPLLRDGWQRALANEIKIYGETLVKKGDKVSARARAFFHYANRDLRDHVAKLFGENGYNQLRANEADIYSAIAYLYWFFAYCDDDQRKNSLNKNALTKPYDQPVYKFSHKTQPVAHPKNNSQYKQSEKIRSLVSQFQQDYVENPIEDEIIGIIRTNLSSRIMVTGGPGAGKTALLTRISANLDENNVFKFYFIDNPSLTAENSAIHFYEKLLKYISEKFEYEVADPVNVRSASHLFEDSLAKLASKGKISEETPLIVVIDALDEMRDRSQSSDHRLNQLRLPENLPEGLHFLFSQRMAANHETSVSPSLLDPSSLPSDIYQIDLTSNEFGRMHRRTVEKYVLNKCEENERIHYFHILETDLDKLKFVRNICLDADHNFMVLRCALNEKAISSQLGGGIRLKPSLDEYYAAHLKRMSQQNEKSSRDLIYAILSFSIAPKICVDTYLYINGSSSSSEQRDYILDALTEWVSQGIVLIEADELAICWLRAYHRTYREFLEKYRKSRFGESQFESLLLGRFRSGLADLRKPIAYSEIGSRKYSDLVSNLLPLIVAAREFHVLEEVLTEQGIWVNSCQAPDGIDIILRHIGSINVSSRFRRACEENLGRIAGFLLKLIDRGLLVDEVGRSLTRFDLKRMVSQTQNVTEEGPIYLSSSVRRKIDKKRQSEIMDDEDLAGEISDLITDANNERTKADIEKALYLLHVAYEKLNNFAGDQKYQLWSKYYYSSAYINQVLGNYKISVYESELSSKLAEKDADPIRTWVGKFVSELSAYVGDLQTRSQYRTTLAELAVAFGDLGEPSAKDRAIFNSFRFSLALATAKVSFDLGDESYLAKMDEVLSDDHFRSRLGREVTAFVLIEKQLKAKEHMLKGDFDRAIDTFQLYMEIPGRQLAEDNTLINYASAWPMEFVRDFRDLGLAFQRLETHEAHETALKVWRSGLEQKFTHTWANRRFRHEIEDLIIKFDNRTG